MLSVQEILDRVMELTGACDAKVDKEITPTVWSVLTAEKDGPTAYRFHTHLVDLSGSTVRLFGF